MSRTPSVAVVGLSLFALGGSAWAADSAAVTTAIAECDAKVHDLAACTTAVGMFNDDVYALDAQGAWKKAVSVKDSTTFSAALISAMNARFGDQSTRIDVLADGNVVWQSGMQAQTDDLNGRADALDIRVAEIGADLDGVDSAVGGLAAQVDTIGRSLVAVWEYTHDLAQDGSRLREQTDRAADAIATLERETVQLSEDIGDAQGSSQCVTAYLSDDDAGLVGSDAIEICAMRNRAGLGAGKYGVETQRLGLGWERRVLNGGEIVFDIVDAFEQKTGLRGVVNPNGCGSDAGCDTWTTFPVDAFFRVATGSGAVSTYDGLTAVRHAQAKADVMVARHEAELYANEAVDGFAGVFERLEQHSAALDGTYASVREINKRLDLLEQVVVDLDARIAALSTEAYDRIDDVSSKVQSVETTLGASITKVQGDLGSHKSDSEKQFEHIGTLLHTIEDSFAGGHARRDVIAVTRVDAITKMPVYEVFSVADVGLYPDATFTVDWSHQMADLAALINDTLKADERCAPVYKGAEPYFVSEGVPLQLCVGQPVSTGVVGTIGSSSVGWREAYEMHHGTRPLFGAHEAL